MNNNNLKLPLSNKLKECRIKAGLSQFDVMIKMGFRSNERISKWENGTKLTSLVNLFKIATIYCVSPKDLYPEITQIILENEKHQMDLPH